jgi:8-oxo-dGTP pyrophosphatase MutT (NUDIX family)
LPKYRFRRSQEEEDVKTLAKVDRDILWVPKPGEGRLYITDELPSLRMCSTAFGFAFQGNRILLTRLRTRNWDIPGGVIDPGETPEQAAIREVWEEASARVQILEPIGIQEIETFGPKPAGYRWPYPISVQVYYLCRLVELPPFRPNEESGERAFFAPAEARVFPTMANHDAIYEEALRRITANRSA